ncbi:carboxypeptidase regulatory-like domain-containing protein [Thalassomonas viridans]|uniref:Carboxypeptidase regulatory-like domain-containing protein n=1 Tax=Thalassomonas viridans TaxID=137584 RepID=A0AAE9Z526_9GAMM|nr:DUF6795 domain-containing protein [Thalassomonas viridans]WDE05282.1 carboxypeptidase regulatory-like domain-containing protein [Thalassomonas viridans]
MEVIHLLKDYFQRKQDAPTSLIIYSRKLLLIVSIVIVCTLLLVLLICSQKVQAMFGILKRYEVEMSPEVRGRITDGNKPVAGMQVARSLSYEGYQKGKELLEHTLTDADGRFSFKPVVVKSRSPGGLFSQNMLVWQAVYVERDEQLYHLWSTHKIWHPVKPMSDLLIQLNCDLQNKKVQHEINTLDYGGMSSQVVSSICHWQGELISTYYNNELISSYDEIK